MNNPTLILYLEDDPRDAELAREKLQQSGLACEVRIVGNRAEYEAALAQTRFDLILSDYQLPDYDGKAALALARAKQPDVPFVILSGTMGEENAVECMRLGATDYVVKQRMERLVPAVWRALREVEERQTRQAAETALRDSEKRFMDVIYAAHDAILLIEGEKFVDCNEATAQMLGYASRNAFLMSHPSQLSPPLQPDGRKSFEKANEMMLTAIANGSHQFEWVHRRANGEDFPVEVSLTAISYDGKTMLHCLWRDITERKRAEETARANEEKYRALIETTKTGYLILDLEGKVVDANPEYVHLTGHRDLHEIRGRSVIGWTAEYEKKKNAQAVAQCTRDGFIRGLEIDYVDGAGRITPVEINATVVRDGDTVRILSLCRDITERKQVEAYREMCLEVLQILNESGDKKDSIQRVLAALKTKTGFDAVGLRLQDGEDFPYVAQLGFSKEFLLTENTLIERGADGGVCRDKDGHVCLECTCGLVVSGKTASAHLPFTPGGSFWTDDSVQLLDLPPEQDPRYHPRNRCIHQGYASFAMVPIRNKNKVVGLIHFNDRRKGCFTPRTVELLEGIATHIGAALTRKQDEQELSESKALTEAIVENIPLMIFLKEATDLRFVTFNRAGEELLGYDRKALLGKSNLDLFPPEQAANFMAKDREALAGQGVVDIPEEPLLTAKKGERLLHTRKVCIRGGDGKAKYLLGISEDITEHKQAEYALLRSAAELHSLAAHLNAVREEERAALARELHDDLGQHLTALQIDLTWLDRCLLTAQPPDLALLHDKIVAMVPMVERLTELTQIICASLRPGVLDDLGLVAAIEWQAEDTAKRCGIACATSLPDDDIELDRNLALALFRILQEGLTNVVRHAQATRVEVRLHIVGGELELEIQDNGRGFIPKSLPGTMSLGMLGMRDRASEFGGTVEILSESGKGTTVRARMPTRTVSSDVRPMTDDFRFIERSGGQP